ncbi:MAG: hypothetical protein NTY37_06190 [Methanothrix sp.]|nr:hypothetical protein [Methanothrix sp.]
MNSNKINQIKAKILNKLHRHGYWGGRHTSFDNLPKGFEKSLRGVVKEAAEELICEGLLKGKPTSYGIEVSLNPEKKDEIERLIKKILEDED